MNFDSPAVLNMLSEGGVGMGISMSGMGMSQLGLTPSQLGRADEDERRRRLESIIAMLNKHPGRVGEIGLTELCKKEGVEIIREAQPGGTVVLSVVIGQEAMCDITLLDEEVINVTFELDNDPGDIYKTSGARILHKSLLPPPGVNKVNFTLDRFAQNLEKLIRMDKLNAENSGVGCYKAIFSVHASLKKLFDHEKKMALVLVGADTPNAEYKAEREVLCKKSGRPRMNAGHTLGLSLEYWMDRRHLVSKVGKQISLLIGKEKEKADVDSKILEAYPEEARPDHNRIYSLVIECEHAPSSMYTPIRIPDSWISDAIEKAPGAPDTDINNILLNTSQIDWLDPKPTYLDSTAPTGEHDTMNLDNAPGRLPNIRFVAKFNPPLVVPLSIYVSIMQSVGLEYNHQDLRPTTFVGLALRPDEPDPGMSTVAGGYTAELRSSTKVLSRDIAGKEIQRSHTSSLYVPKLEYSRTLESLPFQHPRQLVELLPALRQYAFTTSLLQHTFGPQTASSDLTKKMLPPARPGIPSPLRLDIALSYTAPAPRLTVNIPHPSSTTPFAPSLPTSPSELLAHLLSSTGSVSTSTDTIPGKPPLKLVLDILPNADLYIGEQTAFTRSHGANTLSSTSAPGSNSNLNAAEGAGAAIGTGEEAEAEAGEADKEIREKVKRVERALDICGDLGIWVEWVGREVQKG